MLGFDDPPPRRFFFPSHADQFAPHHQKNNNKFARRTAARSELREVDPLCRHRPLDQISTCRRHCRRLPAGVPRPNPNAHGLIHHLAIVRSELGMVIHSRRHCPMPTGQ